MAMIDWVTVVLPCFHPEPINGGHIVKITPEGEQEWSTQTRLKVKGSFESSLQVRTYEVDSFRRGVLLTIDGNPVKWFQGHNVWGCDDLINLIIRTMERLTDLLPLEPTDMDRRCWEEGKYYLKRIDVTETFLLKSGVDVKSWIRSAEHTAHMRHRGRGQLTKGSTLYFGKNSRRWAMKFYHKGDELEAKGRRLPQPLLDHRLIDFAGRSLRCEAVVRSEELKRLNLALASNWGENTAKELNKLLLSGLEMSENHTLTPEELTELPPRLVAVYHLWKEGHDLSKMYPRATFYRYRKALKEYGIDIAIKQTSDKPDMSNVVPLVRVLEAVPAEIPDWALKDPKFYFDPKKKD